MRQYLLFFCVSCLVVAGPAIHPACAQTKQKPSVVVQVRTKTLEGKVQAINLQTGGLTVLAKQVKEVVICGSDCRYGDEEDGLESLAELKIGEQIYVKCAEYDGRWTAVRVARMKPQKAKKKTPPAAKTKSGS